MGHTVAAEEAVVNASAIAAAFEEGDLRPYQTSCLTGTDFTAANKYQITTKAAFQIARVATAVKAHQN